MSDDSPGAGPETASFYAHRDAEKLDDASSSRSPPRCCTPRKRRGETPSVLYPRASRRESEAAEVEAIVTPRSRVRKTVYARRDSAAPSPVARLAGRVAVRALLKSPVGQVREAAILALRGDRSGAAERDLLDVLKRTRTLRTHLCAPNPWRDRHRRVDSGLSGDDPQPHRRREMRGHRRAIEDRRQSAASRSSSMPCATRIRRPKPHATLRTCAPR